MLGYTAARMSQQNPIRVFVTHNWQDSDDYSRVFEYLESAQELLLPQHQHAGRAAGRWWTPRACARTCASRSTRRKSWWRWSACIPESPDLIIFQMNYAQSQKKPVVLMRFFGTRQELPKLLLERADETGEWEERGMVDAIRRLARRREHRAFRHH